MGGEKKKRDSEIWHSPADRGHLPVATWVPLQKEQRQLNIGRKETPGEAKSAPIQTHT